MTAADSEFILSLLFLFALKTIDNMLTTGKTILAQRNKPILSALSVILSQIIFYKLIAQISSSDNDVALYVVSLASGIGTFLALKLDEAEQQVLIQQLPHVLSQLTEEERALIQAICKVGIQTLLCQR